MRKKEIIVINDQYNGVNTKNMLQILSKARSLADESDMEVTLICLGEIHESQLQDLSIHGVNTVLVNDKEKDYTVEDMNLLIYEMIASRNAKVVLFPATEFGKSLASVMSVKFEAGLTADCIDIVVDKDEFYFLRAALNDSIIATIKCINCDIYMCTIKEGVFLQETYDQQNIAQLEHFEYKQKAFNNHPLCQVLDSYDLESPPTINFDDTNIVFCIGRGVKSEDTLKTIKGLAKKCGAAIVGTRAVVEEQLIPKELQIGQSGKSISNSLYVGFGVSGASQHMVGIKNVKVIIAINNDEEAPIFNYADYSIVADVNEIIKELEMII